MLQYPLQKLNKEVFGDIQIRYANARNELNNIMAQLQQQPHNEQLYQEEKAAWEKIHLWRDRLESFYIQKSKEDWLNLDDMNGKYFHERLKQRYQHNRISSYQMDDDQWTWEYDKLIEHFVHYYERSLGSPAEVTEHIDDQIIAMGPCLSISEQLSLMQPCTERDAEKAIFSIPSHKSPGQMVLIVVFFKSSWPIVVEEVFQAVLGFF